MIKTIPMAAGRPSHVMKEEVKPMLIEKLRVVKSLSSGIQHNDRQAGSYISPCSQYSTPTYVFYIHFVAYDMLSFLVFFYFCEAPNRLLNLTLSQGRI